MPLYKVYISKQNPPAQQGVYDYSTTVSAKDEDTAKQNAYESFTKDSNNVPALSSCYVTVKLAQ